MATSFVIACPGCGKQVKVGEEHVGKKIRCKGCSHVFPIVAPTIEPPKSEPPKEKEEESYGLLAMEDDAPKPQEKGKGKGKGPPPTPGAPTKKPYDDDEEPEGAPKNYGLTDTGEALPRCPFCAKEMPSEEAIICLSCGYNTRTRTRPEVKKLVEHTQGEIIMWLAPGVACIIVMLLMLLWDLFLFLNIESWLTGSFLEEEEGKYYGNVGPGFFKVFNTLLCVALAVPLVRFSIKRLIYDTRPPEKQSNETKEDED